MEYNGRKINAYRIAEYPELVVIDVVQKESDCPLGVPQERRKKEYCGLDCGNTLVTVSYNVRERKIFKVGALSNKTTSLFADKLDQFRITPEEIREIYEGRSDKVSIQKSEPGVENILYKGTPIGRRVICGFQIADWIYSVDPKIRDYFDLIARNPEYIMSQCGINVIRDGALTIMTTRSSKENVRSIRDVGYTSND